MTKHSCFKQLFAVALAIVLIALPQAGRAEETPASQSALAVSPAIIEHVLEPGKPTTATLQIQNVTSFPLPIKGTVRDFAVRSADLEKTEKSRLDASAWFKIDEPDFILQPDQLRKVTITITAPINAIPGGHYATIFFQPLIPHEVISQSNALLNSQVGVLAFLAVKGDTKQEASYDKQLSTNTIANGGPTEFKFSLRNSGDVHLMPGGNLTIYDSFGKKAAQLSLPANIILPESTKEYVLTWDAPLTVGNYSAELEVTYGDANTVLPKAKVSFWILPGVEVVVGAMLLLAIVIVIFRTRGRWRRAWRTLRGHDKRFRI